MEKEKNAGLPWYKEGLRFECTGCGKCCTGPSGYVWLDLEEMQDMAKALDIPLDLFKRKYIRIRDNQYSLIERKNLKGEYDCVFLQGNKCQVYQARPKQCRTFPWWPQNLNTEESWKIAAKECEGISDTASVVSYEEISSHLQ